MHTKSIFFITALLLVSACETQWVKPGSTSQQADMDLKQCKYQANAATVTMDDPISGGMNTALLQHQCMEAKGYYIQKINP